LGHREGIYGCGPPQFPCQRWTAQGSVPVDLIFIDGDHSYEGVKQDFEIYAPLVRSDGLIAFHDILEHTRVPSVRVSDL
jgi:predicted O-methyltransferase YrrM